MGSVPEASAKSGSGASQEPDLGLPKPKFAGQYESLLPVFEFYSMVCKFGIIRFFVDYNVFDEIPQEESIAIAELAEKTGVGLSLLERFIHFLVSVQVLAAPAPDRVALTRQSIGYRGRSPAAMLTLHAFDFTMVPVASWPEFFKRTGPVESMRANQVPIGVALGHPEKTFYELLEMDPERTKVFNSTMQVATAGMPASGMYDFAWVGDYASNAETTEARERPLIVDVGGGKGQALKVICKENPKIPASRCVLFDRPEVIEDAEKEDDEELRLIRKVGGSFHKEQPINGALIYHIRRVLNDWPDDDVVNILSHIRSACAPDSTVLISEQLLLSPPKAFNAMLDIFLLSLGGKRRDERMYGIIAAKAGLRVKAVHADKTGNSDTATVELVPV